MRRRVAAWNDLAPVEGEGFLGQLSPAVRGLALSTFGRKAAAQFLWPHRRKMRKLGAFFVTVDTRTLPPKWFGIVVEVLLASPKWRVRIACLDDKTYYRFERRPYAPPN